MADHPNGGARDGQGGQGPWIVQLICCGRDDGEWRCPTWEEADALRESYVKKLSDHDHDRSAIVRHEDPVIDSVLALERSESRG